MESGSKRAKGWSSGDLLSVFAGGGRHKKNAKAEEGAGKAADDTSIRKGTKRKGLLPFAPWGNSTLDAVRLGPKIN